MPTGKTIYNEKRGKNPRFFCSGSVQPSGVRGRTAERHGKLRLAGSRAEPTAADGERVLLRSELGPDGRLQPGRQVAQDHGGHEQQTAQHAGERQERAAAVLRGHRTAVINVLGHDDRVLYVFLELGKVRGV